MNKRKPMDGTVLVIMPRHNAQQRVYEYVSIEVPVEAADIQLSKPDEQRNYRWRGIRYATTEEYKEYYGYSLEELEDEPELIQEESQEEKPKRGRKPKSE